MPKKPLIPTTGNLSVTIPGPDAVDADRRRFVCLFFFSSNPIVFLFQTKSIESAERSNEIGKGRRRFVAGNGRSVSHTSLALNAFERSDGRDDRDERRQSESVIHIFIYLKVRLCTIKRQATSLLFD